MSALINQQNFGPNIVMQEFDDGSFLFLFNGVTVLKLPGTMSAPAANVGLTVNTSGQMISFCYKASITSKHTAFFAAALTADLTIATVPLKTRVRGVISDTTQAYAGTGIAGTIQLSLGKTVGGAEYILAHDVKTAAVTKGLADADLGASMSRATAVQGGDVPSWTASTNISARLASSVGNIGTGTATNLTAGATTFYLIGEIYP